MKRGGGSWSRSYLQVRLKAKEDWIMALNETRNFLTEAFKLAKRRSKERVGLLVAVPGRCGVQRL